MLVACGTVCIIVTFLCLVAIALLQLFFPLIWMDGWLSILLRLLMISRVSSTSLLEAGFWVGLTDVGFTWRFQAAGERG